MDVVIVNSQLLRHDNLVNLIDVFRRKKRLFLVFEFVDHTVLDELERCPNGLDELTVRKDLWQVLRAIEFCHLHNVSRAIHIFRSIIVAQRVCIKCRCTCHNLESFSVKSIKKNMVNIYYAVHY